MSTTELVLLCICLVGTLVNGALLVAALVHLDNIKRILRRQGGW